MTLKEQAERICDNFNTAMPSGHSFTTQATQTHGSTCRPSVTTVMVSLVVPNQQPKLLCQATKNTLGTLSMRIMAHPNCFVYRDRLLSV